MKEKVGSYIITISIQQVKKNEKGRKYTSIVEETPLLEAKTLEEAKDLRDRLEDMLMGVELF